QSAAFARLELEHDNLRAALAWSTDQPDGDAAQRLTSAMGYFWRQHGYYSEGLAWLKRALELPTGASTLRGRALLWASALALELADEGLRLFRVAGDDEQVASSLRLLGSVHLTMGNFKTASAVLQECLALFERLGAKRSVAHANNDLGILARIRGDLEQAKAFHTASLQGFRQLNAHQAVGYALVELALVALTEKDFASALAMIEESLIIFRDVKDR